METNKGKVLDLQNLCLHDSTIDAIRRVGTDLIIALTPDPGWNSRDVRTLIFVNAKKRTIGKNRFAKKDSGWVMKYVMKMDAIQHIFGP